MERMWAWVQSKLSLDSIADARRDRVLRELRARQSEESKTIRKAAKAGPIRRLLK